MIAVAEVGLQGVTEFLVDTTQAAVGRAQGVTLPSWPALVVSIVATAIASVAFIWTVKSTRAAQDSAKSGSRSASAAERAATAAEEQTKIQQELRKSAAQPYVWVDVRPDDTTGVLLNLMVGNSGPTVAQDVRATIEPPLEAIDQLKDRAETAQDLLARGISALPPGRTLVWPLGQGFNILAGDTQKKHTITVTATGPFGKVPPLTYALDLMDYKGHMHRPTGNFHLLTKAVEDIGKRLDSRSE